MANELLGLDAWLDTVLKGDSALRAVVGRRVYEGFAPDLDPITKQAPAYPLVVFSVVSSPDVNALGARVLTKPLVRIVVIGEGDDYVAIQPGASRIDALVHNAEPVAVTIGGETFTVKGGVRERAIQKARYENQRRYNQLGGEYRIYLK